MEVAVSNVVGWLGWIVIITVLVRTSRRRKAARTQQHRPTPTSRVTRRDSGVHPDVGAGLALGHAITELHHGDPSASHIGNIARGAYWAGALTDPESDEDTIDDPDDDNADG